MTALDGYNEVLVAWLGAGGATRGIADAAQVNVLRINQRLLADAGRLKVPVADLAPGFQLGDSHTISSPWGNLPANVARACVLLTTSCGGNGASIELAPDAAGAKVIATAVEGALDASASPP